MHNDCGYVSSWLDSGHEHQKGSAPEQTDQTVARKVVDLCIIWKRGSYWRTIYGIRHGPHVNNFSWKQLLVPGHSEIFGTSWGNNVSSRMPFIIIEGFAVYPKAVGESLHGLGQVRLNLAIWDSVSVTINLAIWDSVSVTRLISRCVVDTFSLSVVNFADPVWTLCNHRCGNLWSSTQVQLSTHLPEPVY
jgi:hypothetical protein